MSVEICTGSFYTVKERLNPNVADNNFYFHDYCSMNTGTLVRSITYMSSTKGTKLPEGPDRSYVPSGHNNYYCSPRQTSPA